MFVPPASGRIFSFLLFPILTVTAVSFLFLIDPVDEGKCQLTFPPLKFIVGRKKWRLCKGLPFTGIEEIPDIKGHRSLIPQDVLGEGQVQ